MTFWPLVVLALEKPVASGEPAFGKRTSSAVRSVDPDANHHQGDGAYGRFDGDLDLGLGVGPNLAFTGDDVGVAVRGTAFWYSTVGLELVYTETLSKTPELERRLGAGIGLRPLFLIRWSQALETGPAVLDLALDSLSLGLGASFGTPAGRGFGSRTKFETSLGFGAPLTGTAAGPWLEFRAAMGLPRPEEAETSAMLFFAWHFVCVTPIVGSE
ncbi:MAG TPA: hypothetical protein VFV94_21410 [Polyangiaceae bacterium]|jgi:hypothetical protein|nr:hypothetical protein [Polyangiaceae bacterium]